MSRREIELRVDELADAYSGQAFADAISRYADGLDPLSREELQHVLLERVRRIEEAEQRAARPHNPDDGSYARSSGRR